MDSATCTAFVRLGRRPAFRSVWCVAWLTGAALAPGVCGGGDAREVRLPDGRRPAVLDTFELPDALQALAISPDGRRAAVAVPDEAEGRGSSAWVRVHAVGRAEPAAVSLQGIVRDLLFLDDSTTLYAIVHRPAKRREGDSYLVSIEGEPPRARRVMRLPPSARDLDYWAAGRSLLVAARNELRTVTVPFVRSGPLFRVVGENLSVAVAGGTRVLVGQDDAILLVDLEDPQDRESMPVRERVASPAPVLSLAMAADGSSGLAGLSDGRVLAVNLDPLAIAERGTGFVAERDAERPSAPGAVAPPEETPRKPESPPSRVPAAEPPSPTPVVEPAPVAASPPEATPGTPEPTPSKLPAAQPPPPDEEPVADERPPAAAAPQPERDLAVRIRGHIEGPAADQVLYVVFFGPDNLLREAARARPAADGRYAVSGLPPGRYAVQLTGGGNRVLVTEPRFLTVEVSADAPAVADFRVLRAL